jgi:hypothetical protein
MVQAHKEERAIFQALRRGIAPAGVKRQASRGNVPVSADEMLEILVFLSADPDPTCSQTAQETLASWPQEKIAGLLSSDQASADALAFFAAKEELPPTLREAMVYHPQADDRVLGLLAERLTPDQIEKLTADEDRLVGMKGFVEAMLARGDLLPALRARLEKIYRAEPPPTEEAPAEAKAEAPAEAKVEIKEEVEEEERERLSLTQKIARMSVSERVQTALKGSKDERMILIRDPSKVVYRAVLQSPKLGDAEVESYASMKNVAEEALRIIAANRKFIKSYVIVKNLVNNPRTPLDVSLTLLNRLTENDLRFLSRNRNIPETLRTMAVKLSKQRGRR